MISIELLDIAAKRGEDPTVDGSHGREEGGGIKDKDDDKSTRGEGRKQGHRRAVVAPSSFEVLVLGVAAVVAVAVGRAVVLAVAVHYTLLF